LCLDFTRKQDYLWFTKTEWH